MDVIYGLLTLSLCFYPAVAFTLGVVWYEIIIVEVLLLIGLGLASAIYKTNEASEE